jgi:hypothetical protein
LGLSTGRLDAIDVIKADSALLVMTNLDFLDRVAEVLPDQADRVADIRARAAEALTPPTEEPPADFMPDDPVSYDPETGEVSEPDTVAQKVRERRGSAPVADAAPEAPV